MEKSIENSEQFENLVMQAVDGFLLVLSADGDIIFVSENVADILGIQQVTRLCNRKKQKQIE